MWQYNYTDELYHYGVKGMKWGVRRYADKNGKLNAAGRKRYGVSSVKEWKDRKKEIRSKKAEIDAKADKKYKLSTYKNAAEYEKQTNEFNKKSQKAMFGTTAFFKESTYHQNNYKKTVSES